MFYWYRRVVSYYDFVELQGEHAFPVVAMLKNNTFKKIKSIPIKDVFQNSQYYNYQVEQVSINGSPFFKKGDMFPENAKIIITYHTKAEIRVSPVLLFFKGKNYVEVGNKLQQIGFSNIYVKKIEDLINGWIVKDGSVENVLVKIDGTEEPMQMSRYYTYDTPILIEYHTYKRFA